MLNAAQRITNAKTSNRPIIAYLRVSTKTQGEDGLGIDAQRAAITRYAANSDQRVLREFVEVESGRNNSRPKLAMAIAEARASGAVLVIAKLDRLARSVAFTSTLMETGIDFVACDMPDANRLTIHLIAAIAENEARLISERTKAALAAKKARGEKLGSAIPGHYEKIKDRIGWTAMDPERKRSVKAAKLQDSFGGALPLMRVLRSRGESFRDIARELNSQGYKTPRGASFGPDQVYRALKRDQETSQKPQEAA